MGNKNNINYYKFTHNYPNVKKKHVIFQKNVIGTDLIYINYYMCAANILYK